MASHGTQLRSCQSLSNDQKDKRGSNQEGQVVQPLYSAKNYKLIAQIPPDPIPAHAPQILSTNLRAPGSRQTSPKRSRPVSTVP